MTIASGLGGSFGIGAETGYGASPSYIVDRFYEVESVNLKRNKRTVQGGGLSGGNMVERALRRVQPTQDASGSVSMEVTQSGFGLLLHHIVGAPVNATRIGTSTAYSQIYSLGDPRGESFTAQVGVPDLTGVVRPYTYTGCKVSSAEFSCDVGGLLMASIDLDAKSVTEAPDYVTPTFSPTLRPFHGGQASVFVGGASINTGPVAVSGVKSMSVKIDRPLAAERFYAGGGGLKAEPVMNGKVKITGSLSVDFIDKTIFADRFRDDSPFYLSLTFYGPVIAGSTQNEEVVIDMPYVVLDTDTPTLDNEDVVNTSVNFTALYDSVHSPITIGYYSADTSA